MYLFEPYFVEKYYGKPFAEVDITAEYDKMVANQKFVKHRLIFVNLNKNFQNFNKNLVILTS